MTAYTCAFQEEQYAIDHILALDPQGLYRVVRRLHITHMQCRPYHRDAGALYNLGDVSGDPGYGGRL